ncbi:FAD-dependent oxidoreductase [Amycolatopsis keratiniphila]|uniref:FAD-binding monooxygenase n=1 Tax=Amycolatopsis keratiniphila subsp. keratiniphila TaxID=227715 RepID=A0A1W2LIN8_9PSEU|nr:NAD(P)/FAD-dependent oxidoreductase [Amycolatopsis keratiniphila]ONF62731.1 FAD-binding monooxygenase [Amycolatopsis keratiniphila subsp. keratiniphila]
MKVIVIGAGLGGLTLAHGLRRAGIDVAVYERDTPQGRPQGVSLHLDERGRSALHACLPPAHFAMVEATTGGPREQTLTLSDVDGELAITGVQPSLARPGRQVHRPLLRAVLLTDLDDVARFWTEFTRFEQRADGTVRAWFADGSTDTADVLVGADGIGSAVRRRYLPDARVVDTGRRMIMGATPLRAVLGTGLPGLIGHSPATARIRGTTVVVAVLRFSEAPLSARRRWLPALRRTAAEIEDYVMWALPATREPSMEMPPALRTIIGEAWPDFTVALRIGSIPPPEPWRAGPVTLLGDAIHLAPGFGGNLAMQDARHLCEALAEAHHGRLGLLDAIGQYEDTMRRNGFTKVGA